MAQIIMQNKKIIIKNVLSWILPIVIFCASIILIASLTGNQPFKYDEAVYLTEARSWLISTPANEWRVYRPIGSAIIAWVSLLFTNNESGIRMFMGVISAIGLVFIYLFVKKETNWFIGLLIVGIVGTSRIFLQQSTQFLNDIPASGLLIGAMWMILENIYSTGNSKLIYIGSFLASIAFYLRYGTILAIGAMLLSTAFVLIPKTISDSSFNYKKMVIAMILFVALLLPHIYQSIHGTDSAMGIIRKAGQASHSPEFLGKSFIDYLNLSKSNKLGGIILDILFILGAVYSIIIIIIKKLRDTFPSLAWMGLIGVIVIVVTSITTHAEARYIFFPMVILTIVSVVFSYKLMSIRSKLLSNMLAIFIAIMAIYVGINNYNDIHSYFDIRNGNLLLNTQVLASNIITNDNLSLDGSCAIWSVASRPELSWYSKCNTYSIGDVARFERDYLINVRKRKYSVYFTKLIDTQIGPATKDEYGVELTEIYRSKNLSPAYGQLVIYRINKSIFQSSEFDKLNKDDDSQIINDARQSEYEDNN